MKRTFLAAYSAFALLMLVTAILYYSLSRNQLEHSSRLLDRQVLIAGSDIDNTSMSLTADLTMMDFTEGTPLFTPSHDASEMVKEKMKLYYSRYDEIVAGLMLYNTTGDVYTLYKDEERNSWLDGSYRAQAVPFIHSRPTLESERGRYRYYHPLTDGDELAGNLVLTIDLRRYFSAVFTRYNLEHYQWQWVVDDTGAVIFDNLGQEAGYRAVDRIIADLQSGSSGRLAHAVVTDGREREIRSSYYPVNLFGLDFSIIFSAETLLLQKSIERTSIILGLLTIVTILFIILLFRRLLRRQAGRLKEKEGSLAELQAIFEDMPVGLVIYNSSREIVDANRVAATLFSFESVAEMRGMLMPELRGSDYTNEYTAAVGGLPGEGRVVRLRSGESEKMVLINAMAVERNGESHTVETLTEITSLELSRRQEADANLARSELLARMSFEIRTPLNSILGMTEMLDRAGMPAATREIVVLLRRSAELLLSIINDIFDVSKVESGKMILDEIPFRLRDELTYCTSLVRRQHPDSLARFESSVDDNVPDNLLGDPYRLRQIITNLLANSVAGTMTGHIRLECSLKETERNRLTLGFTLTDSGKTYTRAEIKRMFGDYITTLTERSEWAEDLKLGPVLARQLVELMGGELTAVSPAVKGASGEEKGMRVSFTIKVHLNEKIIKNVELDTYTSTKDIRTLAITGTEGRDDDFLGLMHKAGLPVSVTSFQKHTASQIRTALSSASERYVMLVIFDEPGSDGFLAAEELMREGLASEHIVLMFTSRDPRGHFSRCVDLGIDSLLVKPFAVEDLMKVLSELFPGLGEASPLQDIEQQLLPETLVVDDNYLNRKVAGALLKVLGVEADFASGGLEAIDMAREKEYDLILMDLIMPGTDGFEAARTILDGSRRTTIVALSADNMPETRERAEKCGMKELVEKPVTIEELKRVVEKYHKPE